MGRRPTGPGRDETCAGVAAEWAEATPFTEGRTALVMGDSTQVLARALGASGRTVVRWNRFLQEDQETGPWPPAGSFDEVWLRLPRSTREVRMLLTAAAARSHPEGRVILYGAKDEGIRSADNHRPQALTPFHTALVKRRCRVLTAALAGEFVGEADTLEAWATDVILDWGAGLRTWRYFPGVFSHGRLDPATAMLLRHLDPPGPGARILDYGAGTGIIGRALMERVPGSTVDLLDPDAIALHAARTNVPEAFALQASSLEHPALAGRGPYDLIVSNPPIHEGKRETLGVVEGLVTRGAGLLSPTGRLALVIQRRLSAEPLLRSAYSVVRVLADEGPFRLWEARPQAS
ncbi:MAG: methyltransferase [Gemmatimonadota bacterium]|nr:methyltransferase [Gemmatimonadota bacterium]